MSRSARVEQALTQFINNPAYHDALSVVKGIRNGIVYGIKVRFVHAIVISTVFHTGTLSQRAQYVYRATKQHSMNLAEFAGIYKIAVILQRRFLNGGRSRPSDSFFAGLIGGWITFGTRNAINEQIMMYLVSRLFMSFLPRQPPKVQQTAPGPKSLPDADPSSQLNGPLHPQGAPKPPKYVPVNDVVFEWLAAIAWGAVMYRFRTRPEFLQSGLTHSMQYIYSDSDYWSTIRDFIGL